VALAAREGKTERYDLDGPNAVCAWDFTDLHALSGWKHPPVSSGKNPFPKLTDAVA
jgi:hypothetical protein